MVKNKKISFCVMAFVLSMIACGPLQQSTSAPVPINTSAVIPTLEPTSTTIPTRTSAPTATPTSVPVATATPTIVSIDPFRGVASLAGLLDDSSGEVHVRAPADGSIWVITSQKAYRWNGQEWEIVLSENEDMLAAVDDGGQLWVLRQDTSEISVWQGGQWASYSADSGWVDPGFFEVSWWATTPWSVYTGAGGVLWIPMEQDVRAFDSARWKGYTLEDMGFPQPEMEDISIAHNIVIADEGAEVWVGECYYSGPGPMGGGGVRWYDGQTWHGEDAQVGSGCVSAMDVDPVGDVWLGSSDNVWRYDYKGQSWTEYSLPGDMLSGFNFTHPRQLMVDQAGDVWVIEQMCGGASCDGPANLYRIHNGEWSLIIDAEYWASSFKQLVLDGTGQGWLFWEGMFYQLDDKPLEPVASIATRGVDVSSDGSIWVVAGTGEDASLQVLEP
jgi:hypothetical protein